MSATASGSTTANDSASLPCSTCKGRGKKGTAKLYNPDGSIRRVYARTCTACTGTGKAS